MSYVNGTIKSQQAGGAFTVATLPTASQMIGENIGVTAYTTDGGMQVWNGSTWSAVNLSQGVTPYTGLVASRCVMPNFQTTANKQTFSRVNHVAMDNLTTVQFVYCTAGLGTQYAETYAGAAASVTAGFEYNGVTTPVTFGGSSTGTIPIYGILVSDPITLPTPVPRGMTFYSRTWQSSTWGSVYCVSLGSLNNAGAGVNSQGNFFAVGNSVADQTTGIGAPAGSTGLGLFGPAAIIGQTTRPSFLLVGDSRMQGTGGDSTAGAQSQYGAWGNVARWMVKRFASLNTGISADRMQYVAYSGSALTNVATTGTGGQFSFTTAPSTLQINMIVTITGNLTGTGTIAGYVSGNTYKITATNTTTTFTLTDILGNAIVTTAGTLTGLTFNYYSWLVRGLFVPYVSHAVCQMGINDCYALNSGLTIVSNLYTFAKNKLTGKPVFQTTLEPYTTSTDMFMSTTNQTPSTNANPNRIVFNDLVRQGLQYPIVGCIDLASAVETSVNSGLWKTLSPPRVIYDAVVTAGSNTITSATANFNYDDYGKNVVISGGGAVLASVTITGTAGQFSCAANAPTVGSYLTISGTFGGTGSITGYTSPGPTNYKVSASSGGTSFTLTDLQGNTLTTTAGTPTGLTYALQYQAFITAYSSPSVAFVGTQPTTSSGGNPLAGVAITGTAGQFSCTATTLAVGASLVISGTLGGTGSITGYTNPTVYLISATNGSTTFTLTTLTGAAIVTTAGTPTGLTYTYVTSTTGAIGTWTTTYDGLHATKDGNEIIEYSTAFDSLSYLIP
jgi:hypothetical protein